MHSNVNTIAEWSIRREREIAQPQVGENYSHLFNLGKKIANVITYYSQITVI